MLKSMQRKLETDLNFKQLYFDFIKDYVFSGHIITIPCDSLSLKLHEKSIFNIIMESRNPPVRRPCFEWCLTLSICGLTPRTSYYDFRSHSSRLNTFLAKKFLTVHTLVPRAYWHHVKSKENPNDVASPNKS